MNQALTTRRPAAVGLPRTDARARHALEQAISRLENDELIGGLTKDARSVLIARREELRGFVVPAQQSELEAAVAGLMSSFFSARSVSKAEATVTTKKYAYDLSGIPLWAITEACAMISRGQIEGASIDFPPAAPRLRTAADDLMRPVIAEGWTIKRVLSAREVHEPTPDEVARVKEGFAALGKLLTSRSTEGRRVNAEKATAAFDPRAMVSPEEWDRVPSPHVQKQEAEK